MIIFDSFMDLFDMFIEISWLAKFLVTELAFIIFDSLMDCFNMSLKVSWFA